MAVAGALALLMTLALIVRWPILGLYLVAGCVVLIEAWPLEIPILTDRLYVYYWPPELAGRGERPIGLLLLFILAAVVYSRLRQRQRVLEGGPLVLPFAAFLLCVAWGVANGLASGGAFKIIVLEVRPFWYLFLAYLLAYNLVGRARHVRALVWVVIAGAGVKALQGLYVYLGALHGRLAGHHAILSHEESFFLAAVVVLFVTFALGRRAHAQYYAIAQLLPFLAVVLIANQRRAAWVALMAGAAVAWALTWVVAPDERGRLGAVGRLVVPLVIGFVLAFHADPTFIGGPARAIISILHPAPTDGVAIDSNTYRAIENYNLRVTAMQRPILGWGFGRPFLQPGALPDMSAKSPYYLYVPHNTLYWVWMRLGAVGFLALWSLLGAIVARGCLIAGRLHDRYLRSIAIFVVAAAIMEILVAYADYQLYSHRNVLYLGLMAGVLVRLPVCDEEGTPEPARGACQVSSVAASPRPRPS